MFQFQRDRLKALEPPTPKKPSLEKNAQKPGQAPTPSPSPKEGEPAPKKRVSEQYNEYKHTVEEFQKQKALAKKWKEKYEAEIAHAKELNDRRPSNLGKRKPEPKEEDQEQEPKEKKKRKITPKEVQEDAELVFKVAPPRKKKIEKLGSKIQQSREQRAQLKRKMAENWEETAKAIDSQMRPKKEPAPAPAEEKAQEEKEEKK